MKNIKEIEGLPLIAHSINYAKSQEEIKNVYVTTDNSEIKEIAKHFGAFTIDRPQELSGDNEPTVSALKHALETINSEVDNVILLQPTNPFRPKKMFKKALDVLKNSKSSSLFTVTRNSHKLGKINNNVFEPFNYKIGQRSQDLEPLYSENGLLYITKPDLILNNIIIDTNSYPMEVNHPFAKVDIDTLEDFEYAKFIYKKYKDA